MERKSYHTDQDSSYHIYKSGECKFTNPILHYAKEMESMFYEMSISTFRMLPNYDLLSAQSRINISQRFKQQAKECWRNKHKAIIGTPLPSEYISLLESKKKKAQQKIIEGLVIDTNILIALPIHAWTLYKMPYSRIISEYMPKEFENKSLPDLLYMDEQENLECFGGTNLTPSEMRDAIKKRHRVIIDLIGNGDSWHCFFRTMSGIKGKEDQHIGDPHIHYLSSAWGIKWADVRANLTSYRYSIRAETIPFRSA